MNKKIFVMLCVCLLGAISMTSCIDNKESESVTNIREAKAEQLKALAALSDAQAQAAKILAQAQATQAQAEALLAQANAELIATQAEEQRLRNELIALQIAYEKALQYAKEEAELAKYRAEIAEAEARVAQAQAAVLEAQQRKTLAEQQIQKNELDFKNSMLQLQLELERTQANYENDLKLIKDVAIRSEIYRLSNNYNEAISQLQYYQERLINSKNDSIRYKNEMATDITAFQATVNDFKKDTAFYHNIIEKAKKKIEYLRGEQLSTYDLEEQMRILKSTLKTKEEEMNKAQETASKALEEANNNYNKYDVNSYINNLPSKYYWYQIVNNSNSGRYTFYYDSSNKFHFITSDLCLHLSDANLSLDYDYVLAKNGYYIQVKEVKLNFAKPYRYDGNTLYRIYDSEDDIFDMKIDCQNELKDINNDIEDAASKTISTLGNPVSKIKEEFNNILNKDCDNISKSISKYKTDHDYYEDTINELYYKNKEITNIIKNSISDLDAMIALNPDSIPEDSFTRPLKEALNDILAQCEDIENDLQASITEDSQSMSDLARVYDACKNFDLNISNLNKEINEYNKKLKDSYNSYFEAADMAKEAEDAYNETYKEYSAISSLYYSSSFYSIESQISDQEYIISTYTAKIQEALTSIMDLQTNWATIDWNAYYHERIVGYSKLVSLWQKRAEEAKAELDAAIKGEPAPTPTPDTTPDQGNDSGASDEGTDSDDETE